MTRESCVSHKASTAQTLNTASKTVDKKAEKTNTEPKRIFSFYFEPSNKMSRDEQDPLLVPNQTTKETETNIINSLQTHKSIL
jgi:hypothetical protein